ncbi:MAG: hypothetical protein AB8I08_28280 [Sandaracinaceae bacterium]
MKLDGGDTVVVGQPIRGAVAGDAGTRVVLIRDATSDLSGTKAEELAESPVLDGRFDLTAPSEAPSYHGATLQYRYRLSVRDGGQERAQHPILVVLPRDAPLLVEFRGMAATLAPMGWGAIVVGGLVLFSVGVAALGFGVLRGGVLPMLIGVVGALAAWALAAWVPFSRYRVEKRGWIGSFEGLAPEPTFSLPLLLPKFDAERLETRIHIRPATAAGDYRGASPHALEAFLEHNPRCHDLTRVRFELDVSETRAVRAQTAGPDPKTFWDERYHRLFLGTVELSPSEAPHLRSALLEVPKGLPPASWLDYWGGIQWRYRFLAETPGGPMETRWKTLRVRSCSSAPPST